MVSERRNVTAPDDWWKAFEAAAKAAGKTVSEWLRDCGFENLPAKVRSRLTEAKGAGRPKNYEDE